eukprot:TRINITY_DN8195_c0_g1_i2.p1 TRINITY_DN8195_c0_g1~~TRINITY_DN8195_c0_g1_i2.p1  ORF type:complete len:213 (-),score=70.78 TRINITY_DN8195_c0_g1_i2:187-825(-)
MNTAILLALNLNATSGEFPTTFLGMLIVTQVVSVLTYEMNNLKFLKQTPKGFLAMKFFLVAILIAAWSVALYFFIQPCSNKSLTPYDSRALNSECVVGDFYDYHDVWHFASAVALLTTCLIFFHLDLNAHYRGKNIGERFVKDYHISVEGVEVDVGLEDGDGGGGGGGGSGGGLSDVGLDDDEDEVERLLVSGGTEFILTRAGGGFDGYKMN